MPESGRNFEPQGRHLELSRIEKTYERFGSLLKEIL